MIFVGDSITAAQGDATGRGFVERCAPGMCLNRLGTEANVNGIGHEGHSGQTWEWFATDEDSPLRDSAGFDIAAYETAIGSVPRWVVFSLGTNDITDGIAAMADPDDYAAAAHAHAEAIFAALQARWPGVRIVVGTTFPGSDDIDSERETWVTAFQAAVVSDFGGREAEGIYVTDVADDIDRVNHYTDPEELHPNDDGHQAIADHYRAWLESH